MNSNKNKNNEIFLLVPGFLGNFSEGFMKKLKNIFLKNKKKIEVVNFSGYQIYGGRLATLESMIEELSNVYTSILNKNKDSEIIIVAHSQGCYVTLKFILNYVVKVNSKLFLIAPSIFIKETIYSKLTSEQKERLEKGLEVDYSNIDIERILDHNWLKSYDKAIMTSNDIRKIKNKTFVISAERDYLDKKNVEFLLNEMDGSEIYEIDADHIFKKPDNSILVLEKYLANKNQW